MYLNQYKIEGTTNLDGDISFSDENTYPKFQEDLIRFKSHLQQLVDDKECKTFYKFGDGDYSFLKKDEIGSARPGNRAISKSYNDINHIMI